MFRNFLILGLLLLTVGIAAWFWEDGVYTIQAPVPTSTPTPTPLVKYSIEALRKRDYKGSEIKIGKNLKEETNFTSYIFSFISDGKTVTGQINLPKKSGKLPVVIMVRGYVDKEVYYTGLGTHKAAGKFAENGYITLAPDFLGFGGSDWESSDILEARFEKPITVLNLLASLSSLPQADNNNVFLWGHSNGGQVTLATLEISGKNIPTVFWAPVTRGFPESITDYIGEMDDQGKMVVASLSAFVKTYNSPEFSVTTFLKDINAPIQIHQGTADPLIQTEWTEEFVNKMRELGKKVDYYTYKRDDHNLNRNWDDVIARNLEFFNSHLDKNK